MSNEELILKYVNKNYDLSPRKNGFDEKYCVQDLLTGEVFYTTKSFVYTFNKIIPCENLNSILNEWFEVKSDIKDKILFDFIFNLDFKKGINFITEKTTEYFKNDEIFSDAFLIKKASEIYLKHHIQPKLDRFINKIDNSLTSNEWVRKFSKRIYKKNDIITKIIHDNIIKYYHDNILISKVNDFLESMDLSHGSMVLYNDLINVIMGDLENYHRYIINSFDEYYQKNHLDEIIKDYIDTINPDLNSVFIIDNFKQILLETENNHKYCVDKVNEWYGEAVLKDKVDDLLSQLIIVLGTRNWIVRWIGHGVLTEDKLCESFREHKHHKNYIIKKYDEWYSNAVIAASQREVLKNNGNYGGI